VSLDKKVEHGMIVVPGDILGSKDTYEPGWGTYIKNGLIVAKHYGRVVIKKFDDKMQLLVVPFKQVIYPRKGEIVIGEVIFSSNVVSNIKIWFYVRRKNSSYDIIPLAAPFSGMIHISQVGKRVESMSKILKIGDKVLAVIIVDKASPLGLSIARNELGVVAAKCSICGTALIKTRDGLVCPKCRKESHRKVSRLYDYKRFESLFNIYRPRRYISFETE